VYNNTIENFIRIGEFGMSVIVRDLSREIVKPVEQKDNSSNGNLPCIIEKSAGAEMYYLIINKPLNWKPPVAPGEDKSWMIDRQEYQAIMEERGLRLKDDETRWKTIPGNGELVLPWIYRADMSRFLDSIIDNEYYVVSCETGLVEKTKTVKGKQQPVKERKVWIGFVAKRSYQEPKAEEFKDLKKCVLDWLEAEFANNKRVNVFIYANEMERFIDGARETGMQMAVNFDRRIDVDSREKSPCLIVKENGLLLRPIQ
jgi:hypothetical protein